MSPAIIGALLLPDNQVIAVSTAPGPGTRVATNRVHGTAGDGWVTIAEWRGALLSACCSLGRSILCVGERDAFYLVSGARVQTVAYPDPTRSFNCAAALDDGALIGGNSGALVHFNPGTGTAVPLHLRGFGIEKPGRDIICMAGSPEGVLVGGTNQLLLRVSLETAQPLLQAGPANGPLAILCLLPRLGGLVVSGRNGLRPFLATYQAAGLQPIPAADPFLGDVTELGVMDADLLLGSRCVARFSEAHEATVLRTLEDPNDCVIAFVNSPEHLLVFTHNGEVSDMENPQGATWPRILPKQRA